MPSDTPTVYPGIIIRMTNATDSVMFPTLTKDALARIAATPTGLKLLQGIVARLGKAKFGYTVCIVRADMKYDAGCVTKWVGTNVAKRGDEAAATTPGQGAITAIKFNANMIETPDGKRPSWVGLAHELIHAYYNLKGKGAPAGQTQMNVNGMVEKEEMLTVGLGPGPHRGITENMIRGEANLPLRTTYGGM
jgi:NleD-like pathogen effector protein (putative zinc metallopeptidase)